MPEKSAETQTFIGFSDLIKQTWELYKKGIKKFLLLSLLSVVTAPIMIAGFVGSFVIAALLRMPAVAWAIYLPVIILAVVVFVYVVTWLSAATVMLVAEVDAGTEVSFKKLLGSSRRYVFPLWKTQLISGLIILAGIMLFVIPGIVFSIWFSFAMLIVVLEGKNGFEGLIRSREYMRGFTLKYFVYMIMAVILLSIVTQGPIYLLNQLDLESIGAVFSFVMQFVTMPLGTIYLFVVYKYLKNMKGDISGEVAKAPVGKYKAAMYVSLLIPIGIILLFAYTIARFPAGLLKEMWNEPRENNMEWVVPTSAPEDFSDVENGII